MTLLNPGHPLQVRLSYLNGLETSRLRFDKSNIMRLRLNEAYMYR